MSLLKRWEPEDVVARTIPLFKESLPELVIAPSDSPFTHEKLEFLRAKAVEILLKTEGEAGVLRLADGLSRTRDLARLTGQALPSAQAIFDLCRRALAHGTPSAIDLACGQIGRAHV